MPQVNKALGRLVRSLVESTKPFVRWMDGTSIETPEQRGASEDDEPIVFTFYWDVAANPSVCREGQGRRTSLGDWECDQ